MNTLSDQQQVFLNMIEPTMKKACYNGNIIPSVFAALAIFESSWGNDRDCVLSNNLFKERIDSTWKGKCYSLETQEIYKNQSASKENKSVLIKCFDSFKDSITSWISYILTSRRSENGPLKYDNILYDTEYKSVIYKLSRAGYFKDHLSWRYEDPNKLGNIINIIENCGLYEWDNELKESIEMSKKNRYKSNNTTNNAEETPVLTFTDTAEDSSDAFVNINHMYRVRADWDKPDTQIFASPDYDTAKEEALKHEGYKIYIDDDGELFEDPWLEIYAEKEKAAATKAEEDNSPIKKLIMVQKGEKVILNNTPVFASASISTATAYLTGEFYYYDNTVTYGRAKITKKKNPSGIKDLYGYIMI